MDSNRYPIGDNILTKGDQLSFMLAVSERVFLYNLSAKDDYVELHLYDKKGEDVLMVTNSLPWGDARRVHGYYTVNALTKDDALSALHELSNLLSKTDLTT